MDPTAQPLQRTLPSAGVQSGTTIPTGQEQLPASLNAGIQQGQAGDFASPEFSNALVQLLQNYQKIGTSGLSKAQFDITQQGLQTQQQVPQQFIGASPSVQQSVLSGAAQPANANLQGLNNLQQTFGQRVQGLGNALNTIQTIQKQAQTQADSVIKTLITNAPQVLEQMDPKQQAQMEAAAGWPKGSMAKIGETLKQQQLQNQAQQQAITDYYKQAALQISGEKGLVGVPQAPNVGSLQGGSQGVLGNQPGQLGTSVAQNLQNLFGSVSASPSSGGYAISGPSTRGTTTSVPNPPSGGSVQDQLNALQVGPDLVTGTAANRATYSQAELYNAAINDMLGVSGVTAGSFGSAPARAAIGKKEAQIMKVLGLSAVDVAAAKTQMKALSGAQSKLVSQAEFIHTYTATATDNLNLALKASNGLSRTDLPTANRYLQWAQGQLGSSQLSQFELYIYTAAREYAKVTGGGAQSVSALTDAASAKADSLLNAAQNPQQFQAVADGMKNDMANVNGEFSNQINDFAPNVAGLLGLNQSEGGSTSQTNSQSNQVSSIQNDVKQAIHDTSRWQNREQLISALAQHYGISQDQAAQYVYGIWKDNTQR